MVDVAKIGLIIAGIIVLTRRRVPLSITLIASALVLGLLFRLAAADMLDGVRRAFLNADNLKLVAALQLVLLFSAVLKENGAMQRAISALSGAVRDARVTVAIIPAIIGMLPVVGGAMLSAPLVGAASDELKLTAERRTFLNFWFRHVWEYSLPTFSAVFLTASIVGVSVPELVAAGTPLTLAAMAAGVIFGFRGVRPVRRAGSPGSLRGAGRQLAEFGRHLLPLFLVIILTVGLDIHLAYPLAAITAGVVLSSRMPMARLGALAREHLSIDLAFLIWGIMLFKEILSATGAMASIAADLSAMGIHPLVLVILLPALIAFITGYPTAFVGLSFPVLVPFIPEGGLAAYYAMLGLASGICGHLLSPMHACLVMTIQYYQAEISRTYRLLFAPTAMIFLAAVAVFLAAQGLARLTG